MAKPAIHPWKLAGVVLLLLLQREDHTATVRELALRLNQSHPEPPDMYRSVYGALDALVGADCVETASESRVIYSLTPKGLEEAKMVRDAWLFLTGAVQEPPREELDPLAKWRSAS